MKQIPLSQDKFALVDDEDYKELNRYKWHYAKSSNARYGYAVRRLVRNNKRSLVLMHRTIFLPKNGELVDHINHDGLDNRRENLRLVSSAQNAQNARCWRTKKSPAGKGVSLKRDHNGVLKYWRVSICANGKRISIGNFPTKELAEAAYREAALKLHGEFACTT